LDDESIPQGRALALEDLGLEYVSANSPVSLRQAAGVRADSFFNLESTFIRVENIEQYLQKKNSEIVRENKVKHRFRSNQPKPRHRVYWTPITYCQAQTTGILWPRVLNLARPPLFPLWFVSSKFVFTSRPSTQWERDPACGRAGQPSSSLSVRFQGRKVKSPTESFICVGV
jgi:hypothetical protein